jgi:hypothetical protein
MRRMKVLGRERLNHCLAPYNVSKLMINLPLSLSVGEKFMERQGLSHSWAEQGHGPPQVSII